jgi:uncharacterized lipoprotein YddW (UPF0748 family)
MMAVMLSTIDNPFDPFEDYPAWYAWDTASGYHTNSYLARIVHTSDELSVADQAQAIEDAIDEIVTMNINGMYIKVTKQTE